MLVLGDLALGVIYGLITVIHPKRIAQLVIFQMTAIVVG